MLQGPRVTPGFRGFKACLLLDLKGCRGLRVTPGNAAGLGLKGLKVNQLRARADRKEFRASKVIRASKAFRVNLSLALVDLREFRGARETPESEQLARPGYLLSEPPGLAESDTD